MSKRNKIIYWVATLWLALGMTSSAVVQLIGVEETQLMMNHLGYPNYFTKILGMWKILGVIAILIPKWPVVKEWAYAGFFFVSTGAIISHVVLGDGIGDVFPGILLLTLTIVSWVMRPKARKVSHTI